MLDQYLIIHKSILPEYYEKVIEARRLIEDGKIKDVSQAVRQVGISRSTYYKYKDFILEPTEISGGRKAVLSMMLEHEQGVLSVSPRPAPISLRSPRAFRSGTRRASPSRWT